MSSTLAAEKNAFGSRSKLILSVFCCIGIGGFSASVVNTILVIAGRHAIERDINNLEWVWRLLLGLGVVPAALTVYARLTMRETGPYEKCTYYVPGSGADSPSDVATSTALTANGSRGLKEQFADFREYFRTPRHGMALFAVSAVWFLL